MGNKIFNILAINDIRYLKITFANINSYHKLDGGKQQFKIYIDKDGENFLLKNKNKLNHETLVTYKIFKSDKYWQKNKIKIYEDYHLKDDFIIIDADSLWYNLPKFYEDKITFLNISYQLKEHGDHKGLHTLNDEITPNYTNNQIGVLHIPLSLQYPSLLEEWYKLCDKIYSLKNVRPGVNTQCEQLAISLISQLNNLPLNFLKGSNNGPRNTHIVQSLYWSCFKDGVKNQQLKNHGWR
jgi:hypothetical protein